jgi:hypothetical protein
VVVIVTIGGEAPALAAKAASATIPIVFVGGADPIRSGIVTSVQRPGGNITGVSTLIFELEPKRLGLLGDRMRSWSRRIHSFSIAQRKLWCWRPAMQFRRSTLDVSSPPLAG